MLDRALALGFDAVVTGHHARLVDGRLMRSVDAAKDQSYVLAVLTPRQLAHAMFPLGDSTKAQVRAEAARRGLAVADKPDSHDICFIPDGDTRGFLARQLGAQDGPIVDAVSGDTLGGHDGSFGFTVGQRRGLRLTAHGARRRAALRPVDPARDEHGDGRAGRVARRRRGDRARGRCGRRASAAAGEVECSVQLRAHGMVSRRTGRGDSTIASSPGCTSRSAVSRPARRW